MKKTITIKEKVCVCDICGGLSKNDFSINVHFCNEHRFEEGIFRGLVQSKFNKTLAVFLKEIKEPKKPQELQVSDK